MFFFFPSKSRLEPPTSKASGGWMNFRQHDLKRGQSGNVWDETFHILSVPIRLLHPGRLTWNIQITHLERKMIFQTPMIMFHANLQGCMLRIVMIIYDHSRIPICDTLASPMAQFVSGFTIHIPIAPLMAYYILYNTQVS